MTADEELESFATTDEDLPGLAILDSGCTKTMHGTDWAARYEDELSRMGVSFKVKRKAQTFKGVGGQVQSDIVKLYRVGISKNHGELYSSEAPDALPLLLSRPCMEELGTVIDIGAGVVTFNSLGVKDLPLIRTAKGHFAVNLLDFNLDSLDDFSFTHDSSDEAAAVHEETEDKSQTEEERAEREFYEDAMKSYNEHLAPEGWNPDDWQDHGQLDMMKDEVDAWEEYQRMGQAADASSTVMFLRM